MVNNEIKVLKNERLLKTDEITLKIQDGAFIQIDKNEKIRFR